MKQIKYLLITLLLSINTLQYAGAWSNNGHEITAAIAKDKISSKTKADVEALLKLPVSSIGTTLMSFKTNSIITSAVWADSIKSANYPNKAFYKEQHYIDIPLVAGKDNDFQSNVKPFLKKENHILGGIYSAVKTLKSNKKTEEQAIALRFLIHFVGDLHQPLHVAEPIIFDTNTRGGNSIKIFTNQNKIVKNPFSNKANRNLHAFWDGMGGAFPPLANPVFLKAEALAKEEATATKYGKQIIKQYQATQALNKLLTDPNIINWVEQNYEIAKEAIVKLTFKKHDSSIYTNTIDDAYIKFAQTTSTQQVYLGGMRLAMLLNAIFDSENADKAYVDYVNHLQ